MTIPLDRSPEPCYGILMMLTLLQRYTRAIDRAALLAANNRPRAARRWLRRAGGMRTVLHSLGVET